MRPVLAQDPRRRHTRGRRRGAAGLHLHRPSRRTSTGVDVIFTDGSRRRYDLVVGADGLYSKMREAVLPRAPKPRYSGQGVWRAVVPRPPEVERPRRCGSARRQARRRTRCRRRRCTCSSPRTGRRTSTCDPATFVPSARAARPTSRAPVLQAMRAQARRRTRCIVYRPLEGLLVPQPWYARPRRADRRRRARDDAAPGFGRLHRHRGRDRAGRGDSAATPTWHDGAATAFERAALGALPDGGGELRAGWAKSRSNGGDKDEHARIMRDSMMALAQPI